MNDLFEAYIAALARRALRDGDLAVQAQNGFRYCLVEKGEEGRKRFQTMPDLLIQRDGHIVMMIDTKWKLIGQNPEDRKRGISQSDVYQMMAYARLYRCQEVVLLYPHNAALGSKPLDASYAIIEGGERLRVASVDIAAGEAVVMQQLTRLISPATAAQPVALD